MRIHGDPHLVLLSEAWRSQGKPRTVFIPLTRSIAKGDHVDEPHGFHNAPCLLQPASENSWILQEASCSWITATPTPLPSPPFHFSPLHSPPPFFLSFLFSLSFFFPFPFLSFSAISSLPSSFLLYIHPYFSSLLLSLFLASTKIHWLFACHILF